MKTKTSCSLVCAVLAFAPASQAVTLTVDPSSAWLGFMNVFELPENGGGFVFDSTWGTPDLVANFDGPVLTLSPNNIDDPNEFWYQGGGAPGNPGNKLMEANFFVQETGTLAGETLTFEGFVISKSWTSSHATRAFIKDFAPDFSSVIETFLPLDSTGAFSVSYTALNDPSRHIQYGFETTGPNVWITDNSAFGNIQITAIPEASTTLLGTLAGLSLLARRRRA